VQCYNNNNNNNNNNIVIYHPFRNTLLYVRVDPTFPDLRNFHSNRTLFRLHTHPGRTYIFWISIAPTKPTCNGIYRAHTMPLAKLTSNPHSQQLPFVIFISPLLYRCSILLTFRTTVERCP
jgi:hypothetical protein